MNDQAVPVPKDGNSKLKWLTRERMTRTGEPYTLARRRVMEERAAAQAAAAVREGQGYPGKEVTASG